jgi:hypothetical protein
MANIMEKNFNYEIWALGYNADQEATDQTRFLGMLPTAEEAVNHAKKFYDLECIFGKDMVSEELYEGEFMEVRVEKCYDNEEDDEVSCDEVVYAVRLYQDGTSEVVQDFKA